MLFAPLEFPVKALAPTAVLVDTAPAPRPTVKPWMVAPRVLLSVPVTASPVEVNEEDSAPPAYNRTVFAESNPIKLLPVALSKRYYFPVVEFVLNAALAWA